MSLKLFPNRDQCKALMLATQHNIMEYLYTFSLILIAITLPTKWIQLNGLCILFMCALWIIDKGRTDRFNLVIRSPRIIILTSLFFFYVFSVFYSKDLIKGLSHLETRVSLLAFPIVMLSFYKIEKEKLQLVLAAFLTSCLVISLLCLVHTIYSNYINGRSYISYYHWYYSSDSLVEHYGFHPTYFSMYCALCIFITIYFAKNKRIRLPLAIILITYFIVFQLLLASRTGVLAFAVVTIFSILYEAYRAKRLWLGAISVLLFFIIMGASIYNSTILREKYFAMFDYNINQYTEAFRIIKRFESWESSLQIARNNPLLGVGVGDAKNELKKIYFERGFQEGYDNRYDSHNLFLETVVSCGLVGLVLLIAIFVLSLYTAIQHRNILCLQFLLLFFMLSIPEASFSVQKGVVFFAFFNSLFLATMTKSGDANLPSQRLRQNDDQLK